MNIHESIIELAQSELERRQGVNSAYSLRAYAKDLEVSNTGLSQVLSQKRSLSKKMALRIIDSLKITKKEKAQLLSKLLGKLEANKLTKKNQFLKPNRSFISLDVSEKYIVSNWWAYAILTVGKSEAYDGSIGFLSYRLNLPRETIEECLQHLCNKNLCKELGQGKYEFTKEDFTTTHNIPNPYLRKQHKDLLIMGIEKIDRLVVDQRDFSFVCMNASKKDMSRMKQWITKFRREFMNEFENNKIAEPFRLCIQLFPINEKDSDE